jgi:hypothetical protein
MDFTFTSPRFAGDALLEEIANDPDTGTKKLQKGSPADSVTKVQQVLFDLGWANRIAHPVLDPAVFADGDYGPVTTETVLAYKQHYDIHFPPSEPTGFVDGFAGPRTLQKLDGHCSLLDEAAAALAAKGSAVEAVSGEQFHGPATAILGTRGAFTGRSSGGMPALQSGIWYRRGLGAYLVRAPFWNDYVQSDEATGRLGFPIGDDHDDGPGFVRQDFEWGSLRFDTGAAQMEVIMEPHVEVEYGISF